MIATPSANTMNHPLSLVWIAPGAVLGFLLSLDPHWGTLLGPAVSVLGTVGGVLLKWWLDRRRFRQSETIRMQHRTIERLQAENTGLKKNLTEKI
jgi:predicted membrane metal-binding protein